MGGRQRSRDRQHSQSRPKKGALLLSPLQFLLLSPISLSKIQFSVLAYLQCFFPTNACWRRLAGGLIPLEEGGNGSQAAGIVPNTVGINIHVFLLNLAKIVFFFTF